MDLLKAGLPPAYGGDRKACSAIYYLLRDGEVSCWHKLRSAEVWAWHCGGTLAMLQGGDGEEPMPDKELLLGPRPENGESFSVAVPAGVWQTTRVSGGGYALVTCMVAPAFDERDFFYAHGKYNV